VIFLYFHQYDKYTVITIIIKIEYWSPNLILLALQNVASYIAELLYLSKRITALLNPLLKWQTISLLELGKDITHVYGYHMLNWDH
jgi:hypothetical protein